MAVQRYITFLFLAGGILASYILYGFKQEELTGTQPDGTRFTFTWVQLSFLCLTNAIVAAAALALVKLFPGLKPYVVPQRNGKPVDEKPDHAWFGWPVQSRESLPCHVPPPPHVPPRPQGSRGHRCLAQRLSCMSRL